MKVTLKTLFMTMLFCLVSMSKVWAQDWVVLEIPKSVNDLPSVIEAKFGCPADSVHARGFDLSRVKFVGMDTPEDDWWDYTASVSVKHALYYTKEMDFSEITPNVDEVEHEKTYPSYWEGKEVGYQGPKRFLAKILDLYGLDSLQKITLPTELKYPNFYFVNARNLKEVVLPDGMLGLYPSMFHDLNQLEKVNIPSGITVIPQNCFQYCSSLQSIDLPDGIERVDNCAFYNCTSLTHVGNMKKVKKWGEQSFIDCKSLANVELNENLTVIPYGMFNGCVSLQHIDIPKTVTEIQGAAFEDCTGMKEISIPYGVTKIGGAAFENMPITSIELPETLQELEDAVFSGTALTSIVIPDNVTAIGVACFEYCSALESIKLSANISSIGRAMFRYCEKLQSIVIPAGVTNIGDGAFTGCMSLTYLNIPEGVKNLGHSMFYETGLRKISLPSTLRTIANRCFSGTPLEEIDIPASVTSIGIQAFHECKNLKRVTLHEGLQDVFDNCFSECDSLEEVILPSTVKILGNAVFQNDVSLKKLVLSAPLIDISENLCNGCVNLEELVLGENVSYINYYAFYGCSSLKHVTFPQVLRVIGKEAFSQAPLEEINLPASIREIYDGAFNGNHAKEIILPEGLDYIGSYAFNSTTVEVIDIPSSARVVGGYILGHQESLKTIYMRRLNGSITMYGGGDVTIYLPAKSIERFRYDFEHYHKWTVLPLEEPVQTVTVTDEQSTASGYFYTQDGANLNVSSTYLFNNSVSLKTVGQLYVDEKTDWAVNNLNLDYIEQGYGNSKLTPSIVADGNVTANSMSANLHMYYSNSWRFFTAPFDMKASDLTCSSPRVPFAVRVFDPVQRSVANHDKTWKKPADDEIIKAGQGFVISYDYEERPSDMNYTRRIVNDIVFTMKSQVPHNGFAVQNTKVEVPLYNGDADYPHNKGWNLVGNPFYAYFDIRFIENNAPIMVSSESYYGDPFTAYSPLDDELILNPLQSFFVQAAANQTTLAFNPKGRQHNKTVRALDAESAPRLARRMELRQNRLRYDIMLSVQNAAGADSVLQRTRLVRTPGATTAYECGKDAVFMTMNENSTAIYTRTNGIRYSLNEQPMSTHAVPLGMRLNEPRTYTLQVKTNDESGDRVFLYDRNTGKEVDITEPYTFTIDEPCTLNNRFEIRIGDGINGIEDLFENNAAPTEKGIYDLQGRRLKHHQDQGIYIENGKKYVKSYSK